MNKYLKEILIEMCKRVNAPFEVINSSEDWYLKYSWTLEQENKFKEWLFNYLKNNSKAQRELFGRKLTKRELQRQIEFWLFNYGWEVKD